MPRSTLDTVTYATILLAPMVTAVATIATLSTPELVEITSTMPTAAPSPEPARPEPVPEASTPAAPATVDITASTPGAGMLVHDGQLVLVTGPDITWSKGQLKVHPYEYGIIVSKAVDGERLPAALAPLVSARVVLYDTDGSSCLATAGAMTIYGRQDGEVVYPEEGEAEVRPAALLAARKAVFADAQVMLARQHRDSDDGRARRCDGVWARRADLPAPAVFGRRALDDEHAADLRARVLQIAEDQPALVRLREAYEDSNRSWPADERVDWTQFRDTTLSITRWDEVGGGRSFVNVEVGDGGEACGDRFTEQLALLFAVQGDVLVPQDQGGFLDPVALMDLERDGTLEAVHGDGTTLGSSAGEAVQRYAFPYFGCSC